MSASKTTDAEEAKKGAAVRGGPCREKGRILKAETCDVLSPPAAGLRLCRMLQKGVGAVQVPGGRRAQAPELADGLAHGAGVVGQALDVFKGQVDDVVAAGVAVEVPAGEPLQTHLVGDAGLAVGHVWAQRERAGQGAALQAASLDGALLRGGPGDKQAGKLKRWPRMLQSS